MLSLSLCLLSIKGMAALAFPLLLETINPNLVASSVNNGASTLNLTALGAADAPARASSSAEAPSVDYSRISVYRPPRHAHHQNQIKPIPLSDLFFSKPTAGEIEDIEYTVPGTQTTLHISFRQDRPLHTSNLGAYFVLMLDQIQAHIDASGDTWLLPADDPYRRRWPGPYSGMLS